MGWRLHWYKADKDIPIKFEQEDVMEDEGYPYVNGERLLWCEGTDIWLDEVSDEDKQNPDFFVKLYSGFEMTFYEVTKKGLELIIDKYKERIIKVFEEGMKPEKERDSFYPSLEEYAKQKIYFWKTDLQFRYEKHTDKNEVSAFSGYEYCIFNLISIYKNFDFENHKLIIYGS